MLTTDKTWIIDPIDGTTNFVHSNPQVCTILGFMVDKVLQHSYDLTSIVDIVVESCVWYCLQPCARATVDS